MFINHDAASGQCGAEPCRWDLKNAIAELNRIVLTDEAFVLDREDPIQVEMSDGNESRAGLSGLHREFLIEFGHPAEAILRAAVENKIDLIAMGIRHAFAPGIHLRSGVAYQVMAAANCPVLTCR